MRCPVGLLLATSLLALSCQSAESGTSGVCRPVETLLDGSPIHVLPGAEVTFTHSPPTSGPHRFPAPEPGVFSSPIDEVAQVAALEQGAVVLQYGPDTPAAAVSTLADLAENGNVIVAPGARDFDNGASVAFTAWGHRQLCSEVDVSAARSFIESRADATATGHSG